MIAESGFEKFFISLTDWYIIYERSMDTFESLIRSGMKQDSNTCRITARTLSMGGVLF